MAAPGIGSLATLIKRLEAATSRLEDIATAQVSAPLADQLASVVIPGASPSLAHAAQTSPAVPHTDAPLAPSLVAFDQLVDTQLAKYVELSEAVQSDAVLEQARKVLLAFAAQRLFLLAVTASKDPGPGARDQALTPTAQAIGDVQSVKPKDPKAGRKDQNLLTTVSEGVVALSWVQYDKPGPAVQGQKESSEFYANRVIKEFKESDTKRVEWARSFLAVLSGLESFVKTHFTTGLVWNPKGDDFSSVLSRQSTNTISAPPPAPAPPAGAPPPPPPPPPPAPAPGPALASGLAAAAAPTPAPAAGAGDISAVFAQLNQGENVTKGLRKVDASQMTHKNPELRKEGGVPDKTAVVGLTSPGGSPGLGRPPKPPKPASFQRKPPKLELDGKKWTVENFDNNKNVVIENTELGHQVNIYGCKNSVVQIKGKINAVTLVSCTKTSVLLDSLVSSLSITSSPSFTVQILGRTPTILIDSSDSGQVYLSKECLDTEIITSKTSAINVSLPEEGEEEGVFKERALPEQLKTVVVGGKLVTTVLEHSS